MKKILISAFAITITISAIAQVKLVKGSVAPLKGEKSINLEFTYENMKVGKDDEAAYVDRKKSEYNKKEAGRGDKWAESWVEDRTTRFHPKFRELFNEYTDMSTVVPESKYTLILATNMTEPGFNVGVARKNAYIDCTATFVETNNRSNVIAVITLKNMPGRTGSGYDFDSGQRLEEAYAKAGKELAQLITKLNKK